MSVSYITKFIIRDSDDKLHNRFIESGKMCGRMPGPFPRSLEISLRSETLKEAIAVAQKYDEAVAFMTEIIVSGWPRKETPASADK